MTNSFIFTLKWLYFLIKFKLNYKWIKTTFDGGKYLKENLLKLGIIGIKLGQFLYTRRDILTKESMDALEPLLSSNSIHSEDDTQMMLSYDKNNYYINYINHIEKECIGSGSLAQVHICYLKDKPDKKYVLKVAHPCIFELENEIKILKNILNIFGKFKKINIDWDSFFNNITVQTDLNNEANNMKKFYDIYKNYEKIDIPELIYNDKYFIVMSYCEGIPMNKLDRRSKEFISATNLLASCFFHTIYKYSMCHGDMHFGNILVKPNGFITLIDFGICNYDIDNDQHRDNINLNTRVCKNEVYNNEVCKNEVCKNEVLYIYREFLIKQSIHSIDTLLSCVIKMPSNISENYINKLSSNFISYIQYTNKDIDKNMITDEYYMNLIFNFCNDYNLQVNGEAVYVIMQLLTLEGFAYYIRGDHNGMVTIRTMSYMKTDKFFMDEMGDFILKFYKLEYYNENEKVRNKYP
jgi:predicted unusual protein kinase regulating ubiquinone biosynthesis (AarF/ABC1/UbiB family)